MTQKAWRPPIRVRDTQEGRRLAVAGRALAKMGPLFKRTAMGHGARGLQRRRISLGIFSPRPRPQPRLSLGEDGLGGFADDKLQICLSVALWTATIRF